MLKEEEINNHMNLIEEKNYEMLMEVLDALGLSDKNRELAKKYLDKK